MPGAAGVQEAGVSVLSFNWARLPCWCTGCTSNSYTDGSPSCPSTAKASARLLWDCWQSSSACFCLHSFGRGQRATSVRCWRGSGTPPLRTEIRTGIPYICHPEQTCSVIPSEARDLGSCLHDDFASPRANTKIPRFDRDDNFATIGTAIRKCYIEGRASG